MTAAELEAAREAVADAGRAMVADGLVTGTAGNVSVRVGDLVAVSPSSMSYAAVGAEDVCVVDLDGVVVEGPHRPSSETPLHLAVYANTDAGAVVHHHGLHSTAVSVVHDELPALHYYVVRLGGPPRVAPYATYGTPELAASVRAALTDRSAALMQNHGAVAYGTDLEEAYDRARLVEWLSELCTTASSLGRPRVLAADDLDAVVARRSQS